MTMLGGFLLAEIYAPPGACLFDFPLGRFLMELPQILPSPRALLWIGVTLSVVLNLQFFVLMPICLRLYSQYGCEIPGATAFLFSWPIWALLAFGAITFGATFIRRVWVRVPICILLLVADLFVAFALYAPFISFDGMPSSPKK